MAGLPEHYVCSMKQGFYGWSKSDREALCKRIYEEWKQALQTKNIQVLLSRFSDEDTYIRKAAYTELWKCYQSGVGNAEALSSLLQKWLYHEDPKVRQTVMNAAGEIAKREFEVVQHFFDHYLFDAHHSVRNAVIGSVKKAGAVNPQPVLQWAGGYLHHPDPEIRREICHGIELRGRTHPMDILPLLRELQFDTKARVRNTLVHVIGQISYKKGCLEQVLDHLKTWDHQELVRACYPEILDVHDRYKNFAFYTVEEAKVILAHYT